MSLGPRRVSSLDYIRDMNLPGFPNPPQGAICDPRGRTLGARGAEGFDVAGLGGTDGQAFASHGIR
jgi:hypothetical protein